MNSPAPTLVIRAARPEVYRRYRVTHPEAHPVLLTTPSKDIPDGENIIAAPEGALSWERFDTRLRKTLQDARWTEIVILDNGAGDYLRIFEIAGRVAPAAPLRVFRRDGSETLYPAARDALRRERRAALRERLLSGVTLCALPVIFLLTSALYVKERVAWTFSRRSRRIQLTQRAER